LKTQIGGAGSGSGFTHGFLLSGRLKLPLAWALAERLWALAKLLLAWAFAEGARALRSCPSPGPLKERLGAAKLPLATPQLEEDGGQHRSHRRETEALSLGSSCALASRGRAMDDDAVVLVAVIVGAVALGAAAVCSFFRAVRRAAAADAEDAAADIDRVVGELEMLSPPATIRASRADSVAEELGLEVELAAGVLVEGVT